MILVIPDQYLVAVGYRYDVRTAFFCSLFFASFLLALDIKFENS